VVAGPQPPQRAYLADKEGALPESLPPFPPLNCRLVGFSMFTSDVEEVRGPLRQPAVRAEPAKATRGRVPPRRPAVEPLAAPRKATTREAVAVVEAHFASSLPSPRIAQVERSSEWPGVGEALREQLRAGLQVPRLAVLRAGKVPGLALPTERQGALPVVWARAPEGEVAQAHRLGRVAQVSPVAGAMRAVVGRVERR
jgi:hypothetical protein